MKNLLKKTIITLTALTPYVTNAQFNPTQDDRKYQVQIDLTQVVEDRVYVEFVVPLMMEDEVIYNMPRMVPGTYKVYDFGRFVNDFYAIGGRGDTLEVEKLNQNQWKISGAQNLYKIVYWADDTYDEKGDDIFAPAGTNFDERVNLLNSFTFLGYLDGFKDLPFEYTVIKPTGFVATSSLDFVSTDAEKDVFTAEDYFELHDCPILYATPDTASVNVVGTRISVGVYSPAGNLKAQEIIDGLVPVFNAAAEYLDGDLPAEKYTVIIYGMNLQQSIMGVGALEHHTSTVVNLPDISDKMMRMFDEGGMQQMIRDIVSHEFFHIVTPLNIHSQQIADYDFMNPQMSEHLWLYEGVTEYNANISQVRAGVLTQGQFMANMKDKMRNSAGFNEYIPFTVASKFALTFCEDQYLNVYEKGALIGMCLDLTLRQEQDGNYGLPQLLMELSATYGKDTFFLDDQLFDIIAAQSKNASAREFFARHVEGAEPLPFQELFATVGYDYQAKKTTVGISTGDMRLDYKNNQVVIAGYNKKDSFIKDLGVRRRDVLVSVNGTKLTQENYGSFLENYKASATPGDDVEFVVLRTVSGKQKKFKLTTQARNVEKTIKNYLVPIENPTAEQLELRKKWMGE